jgi:hypothetical protein
VNKLFLLLLEDKAQYEAYISYKQRLEAHRLLICCLSVEAVDSCKKRGLEFILPEDCYTDEMRNHYRELSEWKIKTLVEQLNNYYHEKIGVKNGFSFEMGNYHYFMLYHFFGALHYRAFFLWKVIENKKVDGILVFREEKSPGSYRPFPVSQYPNCYLDLCLNSRYREKVITIPTKSRTVRQHATFRMRMRGTIGRFLRKINLFDDYLNHHSNNVAISLWYFFFGRPSADFLLVGHAGPWGHVFQDMRLRDKVTVVNDTDYVDTKEIVLRDWFFEWFNWRDEFCGFNVSALGHYEMSRIKVLCEKFIKNHEITKCNVINRKALIYAVAPYASEQYILSVAKHLGKPRVCFQHGEMALYPPGLWNEASELLYVSDYFSFGEKVSEEKTNSAKAIDGFKRAHSIGSPALDKLKGVEHSADGYILYGSSKFHNYAGGFLYRYIDIDLMNNHNSLVDYFEDYLDSNPNQQVYWKYNPDHLTQKPLTATRRIRVIKDQTSFVDLLSRARFVVLDRPSTTSLEACMTNRPVFVLLSGKNWYESSERLLKRRAVVAYTPDALREAIDDYVKKGIYPADPEDREFVKAYGCYLDDGRSADRAVTKLLNLVSSPTRVLQ